MDRMVLAALRARTLSTYASVALAISIAPLTAGARFLESAEQAGLHYPAKRVVWADLDGDTWPDAVLDRRHVYWNRRGNGPGGRTFVPAGEGLWDPPPPEGSGGFVLFADADNDGDVDAFWGAYLDLEKPKTKDGEIVTNVAGEVVFAVEDPGFRNRLYLNDGEGRMVLADDTGLEAPIATVTSGAFLDADSDGRLDLFLGTWYREYGVSYRAYSDLLYFGTGAGEFSERTEAAGVLTRNTVAEPDSARPTYGVSHCDYDGDGDQDLLIATYGRQANVLWENDGSGRFKDVAPDTGFDGDDRRKGEYPCIDRETEDTFRSHGNSFDIGCADVDNDGDMDALIGNITHWWAGPDSDLTLLLLQEDDEGGRRFRAADREAGLSRPFEDPWRWNQGDIHVGWIDADNDGWLDILIASGDYPDGQYLRLWRQISPGRFQESTQRFGIAWEGSGSLSIADFDRDGDQDILIGRSLFRLGKAKREDLGPEAGLWVNRQSGKNRWIAFVLDAAGSKSMNRPAIGARVQVTACGRTQTRELLTSRGHAGHADEYALHFGLGSCREPARVEIRWPDRMETTESWGSIRTGRYYRLRPESEPAPLRFR